MVRLSALLRVPYPRSDPFSLTLSLLIGGATLIATIAMLVWQFISTAKEPRCFSSPSTNYDGQEGQNCSAASLLFASQYYTRANGSADIGMFPWIMGGFGNGTANAPIDYSIQSWNYTGELNDCQVFYTSVILRLETLSSTTQACFYCGDKLRVTCTLMDSERTQSTLGSGPQFANLSANYMIALNYIQQNRAQISTSGVTGVSSFNYTAIPGVSTSILPAQFTNTESSSYLYTPAALESLTLTDTNPARLQVAQYLQQLSIYVQTITANDLNDRPFLVNYSCQQCPRVYRTWWKIVVIVWGGASGTILIIYQLLVFVAGIVWGPESAEESDEVDEKRSSVPSHHSQAASRSAYMPALHSNDSWRDR